MRAHLLILDEASGGIPRFSEKRCSSGLWSDRIVNFLPSKYCSNFLTPNTMANASLSSCAYHFSAGARDLLAKAMGLSVPSSKR